MSIAISMPAWMKKLSITLLLVLAASVSLPIQPFGQVTESAERSGAHLVGEHPRHPADDAARINTDTSRLLEDGFENALRNVFPMTPEMVRDFLEAYDANENATLQRPYPATVDDAAMVALEPGENPVELTVSPGLVSVIGFHDAAGRPWPVRQFVIGDGAGFEVAHLGEHSNSLTVSPLLRVGWTNLVIALAGEETPIVLKVSIDRSRAHFRRSIQVMKLGPASSSETAPLPEALPQPGDRRLIAALTGVGLAAEAKTAPLSGVDAQAWTVGNTMYVRSRHALISPRWLASLSGPNGIRAYRLPKTSALLFSVNGRIVLGTAEIP